MIRKLQFLFDEAIDGGGGTPSSIPSTSSPATTSQVPAATPASTSASPQQTTQQPDNSRDGWVPGYRIRETREAAQREAQQQYAQREYAYQQQLAQVQQQLHALVGVAPPQNPEITAVRDQFGNLYPGLSRLEQRAQELEALIDRAGDIDSQNAHYWQSYGRQSMDRLFEHASQSLGAPLSDEGKRSLHQSFIGFVTSSPELSERYASDPTIIEDFWKVFTSSFIDPARRAAGAVVTGRAGAAIPQDTPGGVPRGTPVPQPRNLDERADAAWQLYEQMNKNK